MQGQLIKISYSLGILIKVNSAWVIINWYIIYVAVSGFSLPKLSGEEFSVVYHVWITLQLFYRAKCWENYYGDLKVTIKFPLIRAGTAVSHRRMKIPNTWLSLFLHNWQLLKCFNTWDCIREVCCYAQWKTMLICWQLFQQGLSKSCSNKCSIWLPLSILRAIQIVGNATHKQKAILSVANDW